MHFPRINQYVVLVNCLEGIEVILDVIDSGLLISDAFVKVSL